MEDKSAAVVAAVQAAVAVLTAKHGHVDDVVEELLAEFPDEQTATSGFLLLAEAAASALADARGESVLETLQWLSAFVASRYPDIGG